jgi:hypothetical protein
MHCPVCHAELVIELRAGVDDVEARRRRWQELEETALLNEAEKEQNDEK